MPIDDEKKDSKNENGVNDLYFIHSFIQAISIAPLQVHYYSEALPTQHGYCAEFHTEAPQATVSEGLVQGPYVAARAGVEPMILRTKGIDSTNAPHAPHMITSDI